MHDIIARLESLLEYETQYIAKAYLQKEIAWLKSLRPIPKVAVVNGKLWKPSEEQMFALSNGILMAHNQKRSGDKEGLESLYNDLKKL